MYFPDITIKQLTVLLNHYGFVEPDKARMMKIMNEMDYYSEMHTAELYVRKANAIISHMYVMHKGGFSQKQLRTINEYVTGSIKIKEGFRTNAIGAYANELAFFYYQTIGDFERGLEIANKSLNEMSIFSTQEIYGIYQSKKNIAIANFGLPVLSTGVLIENVVASGAIDTGIYVGQSTQIIVRDATLEKSSYNQQLEEMLKLDEVTGLHSRRFFLEALEIDRDGVRHWTTLAADIDRAGTPHPVPGLATPCGSRGDPEIGQCLNP